jgi:hypothetical protein
MFQSQTLQMKRFALGNLTCMALSGSKTGTSSSPEAVPGSPTSLMHEGGFSWSNGTGELRPAMISLLLKPETRSDCALLWVLRIQLAPLQPRSQLCGTELGLSGARLVRKQHSPGAQRLKSTMLKTRTVVARALQAVKAAARPSGAFAMVSSRDADGDSHQPFPAARP